MSTLLHTHNLSHSIGTTTLFDQIDFAIGENDRVGLVGHNGSGKSSLLRLLSGAEVPDSGEISRRRGLRLTFVEQFLPPSLAALAVHEAVLAVLPSAERTTRAYEADRLLEQLGFDELQFALKVEDLSGGQQNRLMFARAVINEPDLILLDEPTNHLDLVTLELFEKFLTESTQLAFVLVSHDRQFLDSVTNRTLILRDHRLYHFDLAFSKARDALAEMDAAAALTLKAEEKRIRALENSAKRLANWGKTFDNEKFSRRAKSMAKRVEKLEAEKTFVSRGSGLNLELGLSETRAKQMLRAEKLDVKPPNAATDGPTLFHIEDLIIRPGERVALLGANGTGKTSFIKRLVARYRNPDSVDDHLSFSPQATLGYYDQELEEIAEGQSMLEFLHRSTDAAEREIRNYLINAGFVYAEHGRAIASLSGGERARVLFVKLQLNAPNLLILDEPTNHIDIDGREQLETQLLASQATVLLTSHDRRFMDRIANRFLVIDGGKLTEANHPESFYRHLLESAVESNEPILKARPTASPTGENQDALLERLVELEQKLAADLARKKKHQKPTLHQQWRTEIDAITKKL